MDLQLDPRTVRRDTAIAEELARREALRGTGRPFTETVAGYRDIWLSVNPFPRPEPQAILLGGTAWAAPSIDSLLRMGARGFVAGSVLARRALPSARREGIVPPETVSAALNLRADEIEAAIAEIQGVLRPNIEAAAANFEASIIRELTQLSQRAFRRGWTPSRYVRAVSRLMARAGASLSTWQKSWALTWFQTTATGAYAGGLEGRLSQEPTRRLWPYLAYEITPPRVRPNHAHLKRFVAATTWRGWPRVRPANGWN